MLDKVAHKTHQMTLFHPIEGGLSLTLTDQGQTYNPKCDPSGYPIKLWGLVGAHSTNYTEKSCDWSVSNQEQFSLVKTLLSISQPLSALSQ